MTYYEKYRNVKKVNHITKMIWITKILESEISDLYDEHNRNVSQTYADLLRLGLDARKKCLQAGDFDSFQQLAS